MKKLLLAALFLSAPLAHADTKCSSAGADIMYIHQGYNKGMPPRDGDEIGRIQILLRGMLISESIAYQNAEPKLGDYNPDFSEIKVLKEENAGSGHVKDFSAKLTLTKRENAGPFDLPASYYMICQDVFFAIP